MASNAAQCFGADVTFTDVPVTIDARVVGGARVVEMNGVHVFGFYCLLHSLKEGFESVFFTNVVSGCEGVGGIETNAERKLWADAYDRFQVFETMADAITLARRVFQKDLQLAKPQTLAGDL